LVVAVNDVEPGRDDASTMWVSDADAWERERERQSSRLAMRMLGGALVAVITIAFAVVAMALR